MPQARDRSRAEPRALPDGHMPAELAARPASVPAEPHNQLSLTTR